MNVFTLDADHYTQHLFLEIPNSVRDLVRYAYRYQLEDRVIDDLLDRVVACSNPGDAVFDLSDLYNIVDIQRELYSPRALEFTTVRDALDDLLVSASLDLRLAIMRLKDVSSYRVCQYRGRLPNKLVLGLL